MKKYKNIIIYVLILILIFVIAFWGYNYLIDKYTPKETENVAKEKQLKKATDFSVININR